MGLKTDLGRRKPRWGHKEHRNTGTLTQNVMHKYDANIQRTQRNTPAGGDKTLRATYVLIECIL